MKLWLIEQKEADDYNTYDSAVVAAETEEAARNIDPSDWLSAKWSGHQWASSPDNVTAALIGEAVEGTEEGVILASFNAG